MVCTFFNKTVNGKAYLSLSGSGREVAWGGSGRLFEAGRLLTFSAFRVGANSRLGAYSNKYGMLEKEFA